MEEGLEAAEDAEDDYGELLDVAGSSGKPQTSHSSLKSGSQRMGCSLQFWFLSSSLWLSCAVGCAGGFVGGLEAVVEVLGVLGCVLLCERILQRSMCMG